MSDTERLYNNIGVQALAIFLVVQHTQILPLSKALLVSPIITHNEMLKYLSNGNVKIQGVEKLIIEKTSFFANFNNRFYDQLCSSINAIQLLHELDAIILNKDVLMNKGDSEQLFKTGKEAGNRAFKIQKAVPNIAKIMESSAENLYLNLRVEL
ncbi:three component ABC system middle component [Marinobacter salarius]|jgi:hypothetical protein|uniref:three component ABC system middle component n=1 Tax=Marinobacter salarius TaxID=1420917 RepID=UPI0018F214CF|nr:three component ABC system middle component [Marinobacter salarius]MBJ7278884.1 hypothetical protein [Marinobacter salarius]|tara:strand:+ start:290 stop:751 length:462 start_codon:yes stop_codon:yes gene_type:complete